MKGLAKVGENRDREKDTKRKNRIFKFCETGSKFNPVSPGIHVVLH